MSSSDDAAEFFVSKFGIMNLEEHTESKLFYDSFCHDFMDGIIKNEDFKLQIKCQLDLMNKCKQKIEQLLIEDESKEVNTDALSMLSFRINKMYSLWFKLRGVDSAMLTDYIKFGSKNKFVWTKFKESLHHMMGYFQMDPDVYVKVSHCIFDNFNDIKSARKFLEIGIKHHNTYTKLYEEEFGLEVEILKSTKGACLPTVLKKYKQIVEKFKDNINMHFILLDQALNVLEIVRELPCTVLSDMVKNYKLKELMWQKLAAIQLKGFIYNYESGYLYQCKEEVNCIRNFISIYEKGLKESWLPDNQQNLWDFFLDDILELCKSNKMKNQVVKNFMSEQIQRIFDEAHANKKIHKAHHFVFWAKQSTGDKKVMIWKASITVIKDDPSLWLEVIWCILSRGDIDNAWTIFQDGINALKEESIPLYDMMILYFRSPTMCQPIADKLMIQLLFEEASSSKYDNISLMYRPLFMEWAYLTFEIDSVRNLFNELKVLQPPCKALYMKMIELECLCYSDDKPSLKFIRDLFSESCNMFGSNDVDLWAKCMWFEYIHGKKKLVDVIYEAALDNLEPDLIEAIKEAKNHIAMRIMMQLGEVDQI